MSFSGRYHCGFPTHIIQWLEKHVCIYNVESNTDKVMTYSDGKRFSGIKLSEYGLDQPA